MPFVVGFKAPCGQYLQTLGTQKRLNPLSPTRQPPTRQQLHSPNLNASRLHSRTSILSWPQILPSGGHSSVVMIVIVKVIVIVIVTGTVTVTAAAGIQNPLNYRTWEPLVILYNLFPRALVILKSIILRLSEILYILFTRPSIPHTVLFCGECS